MEHKHHGISSANFLDSDEILTELDFKGDETFMDAGCGDGYVAIKAITDYLPNGKAFAVDNYEESINQLEKFKAENNMGNLVNICADFTEGISEIEDSDVDVILMINVFHGFKASGETDIVVEELKRLIKRGGKIAIMDFKPIEMSKGPPIDIRSSPEELKKVFESHDLKQTYLNEDIGEDMGEDKSHYLVIFTKE